LVQPLFDPPVPRLTPGLNFVRLAAFTCLGAADLRHQPVSTLRLLKRNNGDRQMGDLATYFWIAVAAIILLVDLWAIVSVFRSDKSDAVKVMWSLILIVLPVVGLAIWGVAGPRGIKRGTGPTSPEHSKG
jgi:cytochrome bd-type quinol oxidase subunit 2